MPRSMAVEYHTMTRRSNKHHCCQSLLAHEIRLALIVSGHAPFWTGLASSDNNAAGF